MLKKITLIYFFFFLLVREGLSDQVLKEFVMDKANNSSQTVTYIDFLNFIVAFVQVNSLQLKKSPKACCFSLFKSKTN